MSRIRGLLRRSGVGVIWVAMTVTLLADLSCTSSKQRAAGDGDAGAGEKSASAPSDRNQIQELRVQELETSTLITIEGVREPDFTVFKLNDPLRVVVDLAATELGTISGPFAVKNGTINEINTTQFDDATTSISRIIIGFDQVVDYEVVPEGNKLKVNVQRVGAKPANATEIVARTEGGQPPMTAATTPGTESAPSTAPEPALSAPAGETPAAENPATQIVDVQIDPERDNIYTVTLIADGKIGEHNVFKLESPLRLVVDFPGLTSGYAKKRINAPAPLKTIRLGIHKKMLRIVMDPKQSDFLPEYQSEVIGDRLVLRLGQGLGAPPPAAEPPPIAAVEEKPPVVEEPITPAEPSAVPKGPLSKIASLDFKQLPNASRVVVKVAETVSYQTYPYTDGKVVVELIGATIPKALQRSLDTSEFDSPVLLVSAYPKKGAKGIVRLEMKLREEVPLNVTREGNLLNFDFERTKVFLATAAAGGAVAEAPGTKPESTEAPAVGPDGSPIEPKPLQEDPLAPTEESSLELPPVTKEPTAPSDATIIGKSGLETTPSLSEGPSDDFMSAVSSGSGGSGQRFTGRRISLDFKDADIKNIFRLIAEVSKLNIVVGDNVSGTITLRLINVPWDQSLAIILQSKKLGIVRYDNILRIAPLSELETERKEALSAKEAERDLEDLKVLVLPINYTKADDLKAKVQNLLSKRGRLTVDTRTNTLIIEDIQETLVKARSLVKTLDTENRQVVIDARVVSAARNWQRSLGIQWGGRYTASGATGNSTGLAFPNSIDFGGGSATGGGIVPTPSYPFPGFGPHPQPSYAVSLPASAENGALGISLGTIDGIGQLDVRLAALENESRIRIISSPRVTTLDNVAAKINQGAKVPFATVSSAGTQTTFVDATLELSVTPHVTNNNYVSMKLEVTNNSVGALTPAGPQIDIAETTTEVLVKDGDTTVIGGIYVLDDNRTGNGIPWLKEVPVLKIFFKNYDRVNNRRELLFFVTPRIVKQASIALGNAGGGEEVSAN